jgi:hypothetical protein
MWDEHIVKLLLDPRSSNSAFGFSFPRETAGRFVVTALDSAAFRGVLADHQRTLTCLSPGKILPTFTI